MSTDTKEKKLLSDIIRDLADQTNIPLTDTQVFDIQKYVVQKIMIDLAWIKHKKIIDEGCSWLEKEPEVIF